MIAPIAVDPRPHDSEAANNLTATPDPCCRAAAVTARLGNCAPRTSCYCARRRQGKDRRRPAVASRFSRPVSGRGSRLRVGSPPTSPLPPRCFAALPRRNGTVVFRQGEDGWWRNQAAAESGISAGRRALPLRPASDAGVVPHVPSGPARRSRE
jgi:hypothetical protein